MNNLLMFFEDTETTIDTNTALLFTGIFVVVALIMIFFMIRGARRDRKKLMQSTATRDTMTSVMFEQLIKSAYEKAGKRTKFTLYYMQMLETEEIIASFGKDVFEDALDKLMTRLENTFPWGVKICKYAPDVITVFTTEAMTPREVREHAELLAFEAKKIHVMAANLRFNIPFNIGINEKNEFSPTVDDFWQNVRTALDSAKKAGQNTYAVYSAELTNRETEEYKFYQEIKQAIEDKEFELYYQPIVELNSRDTIGYESLLRWNHKTLGVLAPSRYLSIMEQSGDIIWVGIWAFEELVKQSLVWRQKNPTKKLIMAMNLSPKQLMNDKLIDEFRRIAKKYRVSNNDFCFEIVEVAVFEKGDTFKNNIMKLRQAGFLIAIDNYGLETNSISMLEKIDIDLIKLDKEFLTRAEDSFLLGSIIAMLKKYAERKNSMLVAENIENDEQIELAKKFEIPYGQGFLFGEPKNGSEINV